MKIILRIKKAVLLFTCGLVILAMSTAGAWASRRTSSLSEEMKVLMTPSIYKTSAEESDVKNEILLKKGAPFENSSMIVCLFGGFVFSSDVYPYRNGQVLLPVIQLKD